jgi:hypothetical protein
LTRCFCPPATQTHKRQGRQQAPGRTGQVDAALADLGVVASRQLLQVGAQSARAHDVGVALLDKRLAKQHVFAQRHVLDPRFLGHVRHPPVQRHFACQRPQLAALARGQSR